MKNLHGEFANCKENVFLTIIKYYLNEYGSYMYSYAWDFGYKMKDTLLPLQDRLSNVKDRTKLEWLMETYYGIHIEWDDQFSKQSIMSAEFIVICMDSFWCPWNPAYQKAHLIHYFIGVHAEDKQIICIDPYYELENLILPYELLKEGLVKIGYTNQVQRTQYIFEQVFFDSLLHVRNGINGISDYNLIRIFLKEVGDADLFVDALTGHSDIPDNSVILLTINHVAWGRKKYITHWQRYNHIPAIQYVVDRLSEVYREWILLTKTMIRIFFENRKHTAIELATNRLTHIASQEEQICNHALDIMSP